ncbi:ABC transporter permease [Sphaerimonospora sp. CA-214678]|uniref:ABC transporter permease n=1 Tax=Sphaerimonospora sp. CA-214678 TaxID=3240029 RepID=UPI003D8A69B2
MHRFVFQRVSGILIVLVLVLSLTFLMLQAIPGGPELAYLGVNPTPEKRAAVLSQLGLDKPLWSQYLHFVGNALTLDLGVSLTTQRPVSEILGQHVPVTLELGLTSLVVWTVIGLISGFVAAARRGGLIDGAVRVVTVTGLSIPSFWLGTVCVVVFGLYVRGVLPSSGWVSFGEDPVGNLKSLVLPAFTLGMGSAAIIARTLRASLVEQLDSDHVMFGRAMGLTERRLLGRVALRNSVIPTVTVVGLMLGLFISGTVLIENVFNVPGLGQLIVKSFASQDYPVAIACTLFTALVFLVSNLVVDLLYYAINPRLRAQYSSMGRGSR